MTENRMPPTGVHNWHELYRAAIFEQNGTILASLIDEAEKSIVLRGRELLMLSSPPIEELDVLEDALYALRALRNSLQWRTHESKVA